MKCLVTSCALNTFRLYSMFERAKTIGKITNKIAIATFIKRKMKKRNGNMKIILSILHRFRPNLVLAKTAQGLFIQSIRNVLWLSMHKNLLCFRLQWLQSERATPAPGQGKSVIKSQLIPIKELWVNDQRPHTDGNNPKFWEHCSWSRKMYLRGLGHFQTDLFVINLIQMCL